MIAGEGGCMNVITCSESWLMMDVMYWVTWCCEQSEEDTEWCRKSEVKKMMIHRNGKGREDKVEDVKDRVREVQ